MSKQSEPFEQATPEPRAAVRARAWQELEALLPGLNDAELTFLLEQLRELARERERAREANARLGLLLAEVAERV